MSIPDMVGNIGGRASKYAAKAIMEAGRSVFGRGDYTIRENTLINDQSPPVFRNGKRCTIIRRREYIADVVSSVGFVNSSYPLNPGLSSSFPWLAGVAQYHGQYRIHGMLVEFVSTCGSAIASTNNALGTVVMATNYNATDPLFSSKQQMEDYDFSDSCRPTENFIHPIECALSDVPVDLLYIRSGALASGDYRLSDLGNFQLATVGMQAAGITIGELWFSYEIELYKPLLPISPAGPDGVGSYFHMRDSLAITNAAPFGTAPVYSGGLACGLLATSNVYDTLQFPVLDVGSSAIFFIQINWVGGSVACVGPLVTNVGTSYGTITAVNCINNETTNAFSQSGMTVSKFSLTYVTKVTQTAPGGAVAISFTGSTLPSSASFVDMFVIAVPDNLS